ncbi:MAG: YceI family protein [Cytophagales bacterium]|nr:YceI family protein [Armatimonadota bacterium]
MIFRNTARAKQAAIFGAATLGTLLLAPLAISRSGITPAHAAGASVAPTTAGYAAATGTWGVDKSHTDIGFAITHLAVSKVRGHFNDFEGTVKVDGVKPENSSVSFAIKTASIDTANAQRDGHLKGADFFDAEKYPEITFKSTKIVQKGKGFTALGVLTLHGVSKTVAMPFTVQGPVKGPDGVQHLGVDTLLTINRQDYGLAWSKVVEGVSMVSNDVAITISLDLAKKPAA